jgi:myo-inositol-1(or 4)-monophosphatase
MPGRIALRHWKAPQGLGQTRRRRPGDRSRHGGECALSPAVAQRPPRLWLAVRGNPDSPDRLSRDCCFIIDPIDGTRAFIAGEDTFAIAIGVAEQGVMRAGRVVCLPALKRLYAAHGDGPPP